MLLLLVVVVLVVVIVKLEVIALLSEQEGNRQFPKEVNRSISKLELSYLQ